MLLLLGVLLVAGMQSRAQSFHNNFTATPSTLCYPGTCNSFTVNLSGVDFVVTATTAGDGANVYWYFTYGEGGNGSIEIYSSSYNAATTEKLTIRRADGGTFVFNSLFYNDSASDNVIGACYLGGVLQGTAVSLASGSTGNYTTGVSGAVDEVRITADNFKGWNFDGLDGTYTNHTPSFTGGGTQSLSLCQNTVAQAINGMLTVNDADGGQTLSWTVSTAPAHGNVATGSTKKSNTGSVTPYGFTYQPNASYSGSDAFTVQVSDGVTTAAATINVTVKATATPQMVTGGGGYCTASGATGAAVGLAGSETGMSYQLYYGRYADGSPVSGTGSALSFGSQSLLGAYTVLATNPANTCPPVSMTGNAYVHPDSATTGIIIGANNVCTNAKFKWEDTTSPGGTWTVYNSLATISVLPLDSLLITTYDSSGIDTISYTVTNTCGTYTIVRPFTINPRPTAAITSAAFALCSGAHATAMGAAVGGAGTWNIGSTSSAIATIDAITGVVTAATVAAGTVARIPVNYVVTSAVCGHANTTQTDTVLGTPISSGIAGLSSVCTGSMITLTNSIAGGTWSSSNSNATVNTTGMVTGVTPGLDTISYRISNSCGSSSATKAITVNPYAGAIKGASQGCVGVAIPDTATVLGGTWSSSNTGVATVTSSGYVTGVAAGTAIISYAVTSSCGTAYATKVFTVNALPATPTISGATGVCVSSTTTLTGTPSSASSTWFSSATAVATIGASTGIVNGIAVGTTQIKYTYVDANGCAKASALYSLAGNANPTVANITGPATVNVGANITLADATSGGTWSSSNGNATVTSGGVVHGVTHGTAVISYSVTNASGCTTVKTYNITIN